MMKAALLLALAGCATTGAGSGTPKGEPFTLSIAAPTGVELLLRAHTKATRFKDKKGRPLPDCAKVDEDAPTGPIEPETSQSLVFPGDGAKGKWSVTLQEGQLAPGWSGYCGMVVTGLLVHLEGPKGVASKQLLNLTFDPKRPRLPSQVTFRCKAAPQKYRSTVELACESKDADPARQYRPPQGDLKVDVVITEKLPEGVTRAGEERARAKAALAACERDLKRCGEAVYSPELEDDVREADGRKACEKGGNRLACEKLGSFLASRGRMAEAELSFKSACVEATGEDCFFYARHLWLTDKYAEARKRAGASCLAGKEGSAICELAAIYARLDGDKKSYAKFAKRRCPDPKSGSGECLAMREALLSVHLYAEAKAYKGF